MEIEKIQFSFNDPVGVHLITQKPPIEPIHLKELSFIGLILTGARLRSYPLPKAKGYYSFKIFSDDQKVEIKPTTVADFKLLNYLFINYNQIYVQDILGKPTEEVRSVILDRLLCMFEQFFKEAFNDLTIVFDRVCRDVDELVIAAYEVFYAYHNSLDYQNVIRRHKNNNLLSKEQW